MKIAIAFVVLLLFVGQGESQMIVPHEDAAKFLLHLVYSDPTDKTEEGQARSKNAESYLKHLAIELDLTEDEQKLILKQAKDFNKDMAKLAKEYDDPATPKARMAKLQADSEELTRKHAEPLKTKVARAVKFIENDIRKQKEESQ